MAGTGKDMLRVTWVTRSFLDYRIPVFASLDRLVDHRLHVVYSTEWTPPRVQEKLASVLGPRAIGLSGERRVGSDGRSEFANSTVCIPYQPRLLSTIAETRPQLLIGDGFFRWTPAAIAYKMLKRVPLVLCYERTFHTERHAQWFRTVYRRMAVRCTNAMCCNGRLSVDYTKWLGMSPKRLTTGHMAADTENLRRQVDSVNGEQRSQLRRELAVAGVCCLYVGRLIPLKGIGQLLAGWSRLEQNHPGQATLVLVGDGPQTDELKQLASRLGLAGVRFVGSLDYDSLAPYYAAADLLVMPTLEDNWSLVVPEAMACGLPVLCSKYNGCWPELVRPGENGWVFDPLVPEEVAQSLERAILRKADLPRMGERSRAIVRNHTPHEAARSILEACHLALASNRAA